MRPQRVLIVEDRETGEIERILESDGNFRASVAIAAEKAGIEYDAAMNQLTAGLTMQTAGFNRYLERP